MTLEEKKAMRARLSRPWPKKRNGGWILMMEVIVYLFILGLLARSHLAHFGETKMLERIEAENRELDQIVAAIWQSTQSTDLTNTNVLGITGEVGPTDIPTTFSTSTSPTYATTNATDWFAKVANVMGVTFTTGTAPSSQPGLSRILYNSMNQPRMLFIRPTVQSDKVQLVLVSLLATSDQLTMPTYAATDTWFDTIASWDFTKRTNTIPPYWTSAGLLTNAQATAWNTGVGGSMVNRLIVKTITVPKISYAVNNNDTSQYGWVYWNNGSGRYQANPSSGATTTPPIIKNRWVTCASGLTEANEIINYKEPVKETGAFTVK